MNLQLFREQLSVTPNRVTISAESEERRNELALRATGITAIAATEQNDQAAKVVSEMKRYVKSVKEARFTFSKPLDDAKNRLIELEKDHCNPLEQEIERLQSLGAGWIRQERLRVAEKERQRAEQIAKLEADRMEAEAKLKEAQLKAENSKGKASAKAKQQEQELIEAANLADIKSRAAIVAPLPEEQRARGQSARRVLRYEVTDIRAVYASNPTLCKLEIKPSAVQAVCVPNSSEASEFKPDMTSVPGLSLWWEETASYRR